MTKLQTLCLALGLLATLPALKGSPATALRAALTSTSRGCDLPQERLRDAEAALQDTPEYVAYTQTSEYLRMQRDEAALERVCKAGAHGGACAAARDQADASFEAALQTAAYDTVQRTNAYAIKIAAGDAVSACLERVCGPLDDAVDAAWKAVEQSQEFTAYSRSEAFAAWRSDEEAAQTECTQTLSTPACSQAQARADSAKREAEATPAYARVTETPMYRRYLADMASADACYRP